MKRMILDWRGARFEVKDCTSCPARKGNLCLPRKVRLRRAKGIFPRSPLNPCPVHKEGTVPSRPAYRPAEAELAEEPGRPVGRKWPFPVSCAHCGRAVDPTKAIMVVNDPEPNRIYDRFACLVEYLTGKNK